MLAAITISSHTLEDFNSLKHYCILVLSETLRLESETLRGEENNLGRYQMACKSEIIQK